MNLVTVENKVNEIIEEIKHNEHMMYSVGGMASIRYANEVSRLHDEFDILIKSIDDSDLKMKLKKKLLDI